MISEADHVLLRVPELEGQRCLVLEDDGRVAYAYLVEGDTVVSDVWLYNVGDTPVSVNWRDQTAMPFQNPLKYCAPEKPPRLRSDSDVTCLWNKEGVTILIAGSAWARLEKGSKPGWSRTARIAGPLAKPLHPL